MNSWVNLCGQGARFCGRCVLRLVLWTLWLALSLVLAFEIWIATARELAVPGFVLREFEARLAVSHVQVKFGSAHFDPTGRIVVDDLRVFLPAFAEPVVRSSAAYFEIDPWALTVGRFVPRSLHLTGVNLAIPAMLSATGRADEIVRDLDTTLRLAENELIIDHLTARIAGIAVSARGALHLSPRPATKVEPLPVADYLSNHYPELCRQLLRVSERLALLDQPELELELTPSNTRGALATVTVVAHGLKLDSPVAAAARGLRLTTRFPLQGSEPVMAPLTLTIEELGLPGGVTVSDIRARLRGSFKPDVYTYSPQEVLLSARQLAVQGFTLSNLVSRLQPGPLPRLSGDLSAELSGLPVAVRGSADLAQGTASVRFDGALSPALQQPLGEAIHKDLRPFVLLATPLVLSADATFDAGWKFSRATGRFRTGHIDAYHVPIDGGHAEFEFDGRHFTARHAFAQLGENFAHGSFFNDFATGEHRFLLEGRLRPLIITPWFGKWWSGFFKDYEFPVVPPDANVDVQGNWHGGARNTVFVYADSTAPVIHGVKFDHARTLMFIRPNFFDGLEVFVTQGSGSARGTFARQVEFSTFDLISLDLNFDATLPIDIPGRIFGPVVADVLTPYWFANPPTVKLLMHFDGTASPDGPHQLASITASSVGAFTFHDFPLNNLSFHAKVHDDEVVLDHVEVGFAGGISSGSARVWGTGARRRLGFDYVLRNASLGQAVSTVEAFSARKNGRPPAEPGKFVRDKANVMLDLAVSAEGLYDDPYSYKGSGNASLTGEALGEVNLLGLLSQLFSFTSLRFTTARASFKVDGPKLEFSQVNLTGANSAIDAHGSYQLEKHELDFTARVNPFQESTFLPMALVGAVLSPFTTVLEVKLTGQLEKPSWAFTNGPTNFLRNLSKPDRPDPLKTPAALPPPPAPKR
jgi:hypothetical protein